MQFRNHDTEKTRLNYYGNTKHIETEVAQRGNHVFYGKIKGTK